MTGDLPLAGPMVIVGCSRRKTATTVPVAALDLYQGGRVPRLRARIAGRADLRARIWILSAEHGLVHADTPLLPYDRHMTPARAEELRTRIGATVGAVISAGGGPEMVLAVAEPLYLLALADLPAILSPHPVHRIADTGEGWAQAETLLTAWSWPCP